MPQRYPRVVKAAVAICLAGAPIAGFVTSAHASTGVGAEWWLRTLHVTQAWHTGEGIGTTVAVLADGVQANQADLTGTVTQGPDFTQSGRSPGDRYFGVIGTGLASLIAGHGHGPTNSSGEHPAGLYGIAGHARILSVRVTLSPGDPLWSSARVTSRLPDAIASGIRYAVAHKASVIDLPADPGMPGIHGWGGIRAIAGGSPAERSAIAFAVSKDVILVAPAGDNALSGDAVNYPAAYPGVTAVGAFGKNFVKAPFSNRQQYVALTAAGAGVITATPTGYQTMNSTWAASAVVSGIAALVRSQFPNLTATQVGTAMADGTVFGRGGTTSGSGHGTVDARNAIAQAGTMSPPHAHSVAFGALPRARPGAPAIPSQASVIGRAAVRDGVISAAVLIALLLPVALYGTAARRRDKRLVLAAADLERESRARAGASRMLADPLLEFFGPQHARPDDRPADQRLPASPRFQPRPSLSGGSTLSARPVQSSLRGSQPAAIMAAPTARHAAGPSGMVPAPAAALSRRDQAGLPLRSPARESAEGNGGQPALAWASSYPELSPADEHVGQADVSGSPPWEPAAQPTTALPWTVIPVPPTDAGVGQAFGGPSISGRSAPPEAVWEESAGGLSPDRRSLFDPGPQRPAAPQPEPSRFDSGNWPIYVWNPAAATDSFPLAADDGRS